MALPTERSFSEGGGAESGRITRWGLAGVGVLALVFGALLLVSLGAVQVLAGVHVVIMADSEWSLATKDASLHVQRYGLLGDPEAVVAYEESLEYPRALRPVIRTAFEQPGDAEALVEALEANPLTTGNTRTLAWLSRLVGTNPTSLAALRMWLEADEVLLEIEELGDALSAAVDESGPGTPAAIELVERLHEQDRRLVQHQALFTDGISRWATRLQGRVRLLLILLAGLLLGLCATILVFVMRRSREWEVTLRESEARFREVTEAIHEVFWLTDPQKRRIQYVSPRFEELWGRPVDDLYRNPKLWMEAIVPEDQPAVELAVPGQIRGDYDIEYRIQRPDGEVRWIRDRAFPITDEEGRVVRIAGIAEDVTRRKALESEMIGTRALRSIGRMSGSVAHEFNNLLTVVHGHLEMLLSEPELPDSAIADLHAIRDVSQRGAVLTKQLLAISGRRVVVEEPVHLQSFLNETRPLADRLLVDGQTLELHIEDGLPPAEIDPAHLREAVLELVENAAQAMGPNGRVRISASRWTGTGARTDTGNDGNEIGGSRPPEGASRLELQIQDDGPGIAPELLDQVLQPFAGPEKGDGRIALGLASVQGILRQSGGEMRIASQVGVGTTVFVYLPVWDGAAAEERLPEPATSGP